MINKGKNKTPKKQTQKSAVKKSIPIGRTIKTQDKHLPYDEKKVKALKDKRWVAVIDKNDRNDLAVVRLTDERQPNTTALPSYKKGNQRGTYFKHFVETEDKSGNPIRVDGKRFVENSPKYDLNKDEIKKVQTTVRAHCKQSSENQKKLARLKGKNK